MVYVIFAVILQWSVDVLLLLAAKRFSGHPIKSRRCLMSAFIGSCFTALSMIPGLFFLQGNWWWLIRLGLINYFAFGISKKNVHLWVLFIIFQLALRGVTGQQVKPIRQVLFAACAFSVLVISGACRKCCGRKLIPVEVTYKGKTLCLTALEDTGNLLTDPVTGQSVPILDAPSAQRLTGLSHQQLTNPIETIGALPGLRLIPCKTVSGGGMLLAMRLPRVKIGEECISALVAFSPEILDPQNSYQMLTGGIL